MIHSKSGGREGRVPQGVRRADSYQHVRED